MRRFLLTVAAAATTLASTACSDAIGIGSNVTGSYELRTLNGQSLPASDGSVIIVGGVLELDSNGTFVDILQFRVSGDPLVRNDEQSGTWDRNGDEIRLEYDNGSVFFADRLSSSQLVVNDNSGNTLEYRRF
jgi:hypothetical protein